MTISRRILFGSGAGMLLATMAFAHCDGLDGPVVQAAQEALGKGNVNLVLIWVKKEDEPEIRKAFAQTVAVRNLGGEAKEVADRNFFETLVRVHRAGEGAGFSGLKPAGRDLGPAIPAADQAVREGTIDPVVHLLSNSVEKRLRQSYEEVVRKKNFDKNDVEKGRAFVQAYVAYIHFVERVYEQATHPVPGHPAGPSKEEGSAQNHHEGESHGAE